jgi:hypothetical protein
MMMMNEDHHIKHAEPEPGIQQKTTKRYKRNKKPIDK